MIDVYAIGRQAWPEVSLDPDRFARFVAERGEAEELRVAELYLVCACLDGCPRALKLFQTRYLTNHDQALFGELLIHEEGQAPKLQRYGGRGSLGKWLKVVAVRRARDLMRQVSREELGDEVLMDAISPEEDLELAYMKRTYRSEFKASFEAALASLSSRERNILRHQVLDHLTADQVAAIYRVHRITVVRWNKTIREKLFHRTRKGMQQRLAVDTGEVANITNLIASHFDVSLRRCLLE
jgi:RNA polymerase sigma-70 factor (ECF subfamily)